MSKKRVQYVCQSCGATALRWAGQCKECGEWNTLVETITEARSPVAASPGWVAANQPMPLPEIQADQFQRLPVANGELSRVLGGGIVPGSVILVSSSAGLKGQPFTPGYTAAKHAIAVLTKTLRLELNGQPVRVCEIAPGMVHTDEFALNRLGDPEKAAAVYAGVAEPLLAEDIADAVRWVATRPQHVNIDLMVVQPIAQAAAHKVHREG